MPHSFGACSGPGRRDRPVFWLGSLLAVWLGGCASSHPDVPVPGLRQRILPPPPALVESAIAETSQPASPSPEDKPASLAALLCDGSAVALAPLTLDQAVELAFLYNPQLEALSERIARAEAGEKIAFADFLPEARFSFRHLQSADEPYVLPTIPTTVGNFAYGDATDRFDRSELSVQWTLWDFGRTMGKFGQAEAAAEIARLQLHRARQSVAFRVAAAFFAVLQTAATRRVAEEAVRQAESALRDARNFLKRGTGLRNEVYRAEAFLSEMQLGLVRARTAEAGAVAGLNQAIGLNVSASNSSGGRAGTTGLSPDPGRVSATSCRQPGGDPGGGADGPLRAPGRKGRSCRLPAAYLPWRHRGESGAGLANEPNLLVGGINFEMSLFEGGRRVGRLHSASAEVREAIAQGKEICDRIAYEVNLAYLAIEDARQRIALSRTQVTQAAENLRVVRDLSTRGDATPTDVVDAELASTRAQQGYCTARYDYQTALARLVYAIGAPLPVSPASLHRQVEESGPERSAPMSSTPPPPPAPPARPPAPDSAGSPRPSRRRWLAPALLALVLLVAAPWAAAWLTYRFTHSISKDAFIESHLINVAPQVAGTVVEMLVQEQQRVRKGQVLAVIDRSTYQREVERASARLAVAEAALHKAEADLAVLVAEVPRRITIARRKQAIARADAVKAEEAQALTTRDVEEAIAAARGTVERARADLELAGEDEKRYSGLYQDGSGTQRRSQEATRAYQTARAEVRIAEARLGQAQANRKQIAIAEQQVKSARHTVAEAGAAVKLAQVGTLQIEVGRKLVSERDRAVTEARRNLELAQTNLGYTQILAPCDGIVAHKYRHLGDYTHTGDPIFSVYNPDLLYVTVNLPETVLEGVAPGNRASLAVDAFRQPFQGRVLWVGSATSANFSLLPRDVSSGEFTYVVQRVPTRIAIERDERWPLLRPGLSVRVSIEHGPGDPEWAREALRQEAEIEGIPEKKP